MEPTRKVGAPVGPGEMAQPTLGHRSLQHASAAGLAALELDSSLDQYVQIRIFKIIVIGDSNVGKTCLTFRFCGGTFPDKTEATIGVDFREKTVEIEGEKIKVIQPVRSGKGGFWEGTSPEACCNDCETSGQVCSCVLLAEPKTLGTSSSPFASLSGLVPTLSILFCFVFIFVF